VTRHRQPEVALQRSVFQHFRARGAPGVFAFHVQEQALAALREPGAEVAVAYGLDAALAKLERWQLLRGVAS
jgi:hypothetical protein